jgi:hypothetical protein
MKNRPAKYVAYAIAVYLMGTGFHRFMALAYDLEFSAWVDMALGAVGILMAGAMFAVATYIGSQRGQALRPRRKRG